VLRPFERAVAHSRTLFFVSVSLLLVTATLCRAGDELDGLRASYRRPDTIPFPTDNPYVPEKAALGKSLFFDPRLSGSQNMNCSSCHNPSFGWEVPLKGAIGSQNTPLARKSPTILNQAWGGPHFFWDGRADSLEAQARGPIESDVEMNLPLGEAANRLQRIPEYAKWFNVVFPQQGITGNTIIAAIATYERTVVSGYAPFDAWIDGDQIAIPESAKRGFILFNGKASCSSCHSGWNFSDGKFHDTGVGTSDIGRGKVDPLNPRAMYAFKTPSLRNVAERAPYMHDGSLPDLEAVMDRYISATLDDKSRIAGNPTSGPRSRGNSGRNQLSEIIERRQAERFAACLAELNTNQCQPSNAFLSRSV
jgi:cytochrome c peroxidase